MKSQKIKKCRVCGGKLEPKIDLGELAISNFTKYPIEGDKHPLELVECQDCTLLQLAHNPPLNLMYPTFYWYRSSTNKTISDDLAEIAHEALIEVGAIEEGDTFLDIGANDGTLLKHFRKQLEDFKVRLIGVEPAKNLQGALKKHADIVFPGFWETYVLPEGEKAKIITAIGMFYDSADPNAFIKNVYDSLHDDGIFVTQLMTLDPMLKNNDLGNICHEHIEYYNYRSLVTLFERNGLEVFRANENKINGGSYRIFARKIGSASLGSVLMNEEKPDYTKFSVNIITNRAKTNLFIKGAVKEGKKVYAYGASTKGNTVLQYYGLNRKLISGIADVDKRKQGLYTVATKIPIVSEAEARKKADYFFVLPYAFIDQFVKKEKAWIRKGGKMFVSIPNFKIYD